jgi:hypothetical protein
MVSKWISRMTGILGKARKLVGGNLELTFHEIFFQQTVKVIILNDSGKKGFQVKRAGP